MMWDVMWDVMAMKISNKTKLAEKAREPKGGSSGKRGEKTDVFVTMCWRSCHRDRLSFVIPTEVPSDLRLGL